MNNEFANGKVENPLKTYRGEDFIEVFFVITVFLEKPIKPLTREQWRKFNRAMKHHVCLKGLKEDDIKVRDHCHYTGKY